MIRVWCVVDSGVHRISGSLGLYVCSFNVHGHRVRCQRRTNATERNSEQRPHVSEPFKVATANKDGEDRGEGSCADRAAAAAEEDSSSAAEGRVTTHAILQRTQRRSFLNSVFAGSW